MKRMRPVATAAICASAALLCLLQLPAAAQTISPDDSWWVWHDLASDDGVQACPAGDGASYLEIFVGDSVGAGVEGAVVRLVLEDSGACVWESCDVENLLTDQFGYATLYPRVGLAPPTGDCCGIAVSVAARYQEEDEVTIPWDGTEQQDTRGWRSFDLNGDGVVNGTAVWGDQNIFSGDWGPAACRSDFNGDGMLNIVDSALLLNHFHPALRISPDNVVDFGEVPQGGTPSIALQLESWGGATVSWQLTESCPWLTVTPGSGSLPAPGLAPPDPGALVGVYFEVNTTGLEPGHYECTVDVISDSSYDCFTDESITVLMNVGTLIDEDFSYPDGDLDGNGDWIVRDADDLKPIQVISGEARSESSPGDAEDCMLAFAPRDTDEKTYYSFKLRIPSVGPSGPAVVEQPINSIVTLYNTVGGDARSLVGIGIPFFGGDCSLQIYPGMAVSFVYEHGDLTFDVDHDIVAAYDAALGTHEIWLDPVREWSEHTTGEWVASAGTSVDAVEIRQRNVTGATRCYHFIDDLKVGTSFLDVYTPPPTTWYVPDDGTVADVLGWALAGDTVILRTGTYFEYDLAMPAGVTLRSESGDPDDVTIDATTYGRVLTGADLDPTTRIEGITFTGGSQTEGAGMHLTNSSPVVVSCAFVSNNAYGSARGGGIYAIGGAPTFTACEFSENRSDGDGGATYLTSSAPSFTDCRFTSNNSEYTGGAVFMNEGTVASFDHVVFSENWSSNEAAGAIGCYGTSSVFVTGSTFYGNDAPGGGGAIFVNDSSALVENTIIAFNDGAWVVQCPSSDVTLTCCDVYGNEGGDYVSCLVDMNGVDGNISEDPLFCGPDNPGNPLTLRSTSPCAAESNPGCGQIGAYGSGCAGVLYWDGGGVTQNWEEAQNWNPDRVPGAWDHARINLDGTYSVYYNSTSSIWALTHGASTGTQTLDIQTGSLAVTGGATNTREIIVREPATFDASAAARDTSVVVNEADATFTLDDGDLVGTATFINRGLLEKIGSATSHVTLMLENQEFARGGMGTVEVEAGTLSVEGEANSDGRLNVNGGATAIISQHFVRGDRQGGSLTNRGVVDVASEGQLGAEATLAIANEDGGVVTLDDGDLIGGGRLVNYGLLRKIGPGTSHVLLTLDNLVGARGGIGTVEAEAGTLDLGGETNNDGRLNVNGGATAIISQHFLGKDRARRDRAGFDNAGDVAIAAAGRFRLDATGSVSSTGTFDSSGKIGVTSGATFTSSGDVAVQYGGSLIASGQVTNDVGGNLLNNGLTHIPDGGLLTNDGYLEHRENALLKGSGTVDNTDGVAAIKGLVAPGDSHGTLTYLGDFVQSPTSEISFEIGGYDQGVNQDLLDISGSATFSGAVDVSFTDAFVPVLDDSFQVIAHANGGLRDIDFDCFAGLIVSGTLYMEPIQNPGELLLRVVGGSTGNARPVAADDAASVTGYQPITIDVLGNDTDPDLDVLRVILIHTGNTDGIAYINEDDALVSYAAVPSFAGVDSFDYVATDCLGGSDTARVRIDVTAPPDVWHVPDDSPTIAGALALAAPGDTVVVECGTYYESDVTVPSGVIVTSETGDPSCVIIDASGRAGRVLYCEDADTTTVIMGITATGGNTDQFGGGLYCVRSSPRVVDCVFEGNTAQSGGGVACDDNSSATFVGCRMSDNSSALAGGVVCYNNSSPSFSQCTIADNVTSSGGGGIQCIAFSSPTFESCTVVGNAAPLGGGSGLYTGDDSYPVFDRTIMAFGIEGEAVVCGLTGGATFTCSDVVGNDGGDWVGCIDDQGAINGNFSLDPAFCDTSAGDYHLLPASPCADAPGCGLVGALQPGCLADPEISVEPDSLAFNLAAGSTATDLLQISNLGRAGLAWLIRENGPVRDVSDGRARPLKARILPREIAPTFELARSAISHVEVGKGEADPRDGRGPARGAGGPDAFGYTWIDDEEPYGPIYVWRDISGVGTALTLTDDDYEEVALPFAFPFYAVLKTSVRISSNGYLTFGADGNDYSNDPIPDDWVPNDLVAPFWDDLDPELGGSIYYYHDAVEEEFIVQYDGVYDYYGTGPYTFEVVLEPNGRIHFLYDSIPGEPAAATVGIENAFGTAGLEIAFNATYIHSQLAIVIEDPGAWVTEDPPSGVTSGLGSTSVVIEVDTEGLVPGFHTVTLVVESNDPDEPEVMIPVSLVIAGTDVDGDLPARYVLHGNYPNPFNPTTVIRYDLPAPEVVNLSVYSLAGRLVRTLVSDERQAPGRYTIPWDGRNEDGERVASGVYFYRLAANGETLSRRMVLLK